MSRGRGRPARVDMELSAEAVDMISEVQTLEENNKNIISDLSSLLEGTSIVSELCVSLDPYIDIKRLSLPLSKCDTEAKLISTFKKLLDDIANRNNYRSAKNMILTIKWSTLTDQEKSQVISWCQRAQDTNERDLRSPLDNMTINTALNYIGYCNTKRFNANSAAMLVIIKRLDISNKKSDM